ncbi:MAG: YqaE/Pmp3 family membrane protein [Bacteroidetes bacterium]|nr:YqaE/Pmp3 family membrane protein [Bacteroidota bacterium]
MPGWAYILIALLLPPLAVGLKYGVHLAFWLCLLFTLLGFLPGLIYALVYFALQGNNPE